MYCENCGAQIGNGETFCAECGAKVIVNYAGPVQQNPYTYRKNNAYNGVREKKNSNMPLIITLIVVGVLLLAAIVFLVVQIVLLNNEKKAIRNQDYYNTSDYGNDENGGLPVTVVPTNTPIPTTTPIPVPTATPIPVPSVNDTIVASGDYILPYSNSRYYTTSELIGLTQWELSIARNEIFARHGRMFNKTDLQQYFNSKSWYIPRYSAEWFDANQNAFFNDFEKTNIKTITQIESARGYS